jgi:hypothetical protein
MKQTGKSAGRTRVWAYCGAEIADLLARRAQDEGITKTDVVQKALTMYLTKDTTRESLLIAKMSEVIRTVENISTRLEVGQKLDIEWLQYSLLFTPELPRDEKERTLIQDRAAKRAGEFLLSFRQRSKMMPRFLESIFGVMLEEEQEPEEHD